MGGDGEVEQRGVCDFAPSTSTSWLRHCLRPLKPYVLIVLNHEIYVQDIKSFEEVSDYRQDVAIKDIAAR